MIHIPAALSYDKVKRQAELDVLSAYFINVPNGWVQKDRFLDLYELIYVTKGTLYLSVNKEPLTLSSGEVYLIRQYTTLSGSAPSEGACSFYTVSFHTTLEKYSALYAKPIRLLSRASYAQTLFNNLILHAGGEKNDNYLLDASFLLLLDLLYDAQSHENERVPFHGILRYINDNIANTLNLERISEHFHYSDDYLGKIFKAQFGVTVKQYIIQKRLAIAKRLLTTSDLSIRDVGLAVGFGDGVLFEKFFKYHVKTTPRKYKKLYQ